MAPLWPKATHVDDGVHRRQKPVATPMGANARVWLPYDFGLLRRILERKDKGREQKEAHFSSGFPIWNQPDNQAVATEAKGVYVTHQ